MSLTDAIAEALANADPPPPTEAATCHWVIYPLLLAAGYAPQEIVPEMADNQGQFPDYTILPRSSNCWYLEAKGWNVRLEDRHAQQAMTYAYQNGKRWVVLSNGQYWRLYDSTIQGIASDRFVTQVALKDVSTFAVFLAALGKESVCSEGLELYARQSRLTTSLQSQLTDPESPVIKALWSILRSQQGLGGISRTEVAGFFQNQAEDPAPSSAGPQAYVKPREADTSPALTGAMKLDYLRDHAKEQATGRQPILLTCPDGSEIPVSSWKDLAVQVVQWIGQRYPLPEMPYKGQYSEKNFLNSTPDNATGPMRAYARLALPDRVVFIETQRSASNFLLNLNDLCRLVGIDPAGFAVTLKS